MDLSGKVAVVTGAGRGIGQSFARALAEAGAAVLVNDLEFEPAKTVAYEIREAGGKAVPLAAEIGKAGSAEACIECAVDTFGRFDILVANAGVLRDSVLWKTEDDAFDLVVGTHLRGTFQCGRAAARHLREAGNGGSLILIGSPAGQLGNFGQSAYSAAKAGIAALTRTWATELQRANVTVNAIIPTALTRMTATMPGLVEFAEAAERGEKLPTALRAKYGIGLPEDVAPLAIFLASEHARQITGQCIGIGGDRLALWSHPAELSIRCMDDGWTAEAIAAEWSDLTQGSLQPFAAPVDFEL